MSETVENYDLTALDLMNDQRMLGPWFAGESWATWRGVLKAAYGLRLERAELRKFHAVAGGRRPPKRRVRELVVVAGVLERTASPPPSRRLRHAVTTNNFYGRERRPP